MYPRIWSPLSLALLVLRMWTLLSNTYRYFSSTHVARRCFLISLLKGRYWCLQRLKSLPKVLLTPNQRTLDRLRVKLQEDSSQHKAHILLCEKCSQSDSCGSRSRLRKSVILFILLDALSVTAMQVMVRINWFSSNQQTITFREICILLSLTFRHILIRFLV